MSRKLKLEGLDCASCAYEIEEALRKENFKSAVVNFSTGELIIEGDVKKAKEIIKRVKPDIKIIEKDLRDNGHRQDDIDELDHMKSPYFIIPSLILFVFGLILRYYYNYDNIFVFGIFLTSYIIVGLKVLKRAFVNSVHGKIFDENFLISVATLGAFIIGEYPEGVGVMIFYIVGEFFQDLAINRSRRSIKSLLALKTDYANLKVDDKIMRVRPEDVKVGDIIVIKSGERVPLDGVIIEGKSTVDTSALTGESIPRVLKEGDEVLSGMLNLSGLLTVKVTKTFKESTVSRILELVERASARKAKTEKFITKFARYYTPVVVTLALIVAIVPPLVFGEPLYSWTYRALVLLVISCPCALVLSIPLGYFGGIGKSAKEGILVKGSNFLDAMSKATIVAFDKTGTLTKGVFRVTQIVVKNGFGEKEILEFAALAEMYSNHPIARAIRDAYKGEIDKSLVKEYEEIAGHGVRAKINGREIIIGNDRLLHKFDIEHDTCYVKGTVVHVVVDRKYAGYIIISDEIKEDAPKTIRELKRLGIKRIMMLTGDNKEAAEQIAKQVDIDEFYAELLPEDKVKIIENLEKKKFKEDDAIIFVGDGINDAPIIARADIGVAMGALGSDAAIETADVVIMDDALLKLPLGIRIARKTRNIIWQNIILALGVKLLFLSLGIMGQATMWEAVFADIGVALIAVFNAMRILK
ncbi:MAG: cadmium-translocating P-type ATPase [Candidatus Odinarchaeota archaeon]|nr:cadmium-translocating P-type ATPase [Candidatus Odinarchaeota archaeon]